MRCPGSCAAVTGAGSPVPALVNWNWSQAMSPKSLAHVMLPILLLLCVSASGSEATKTYDPLDLPAVESPLAAKSMVYSIARSGDRIFAAGHRGHILYSDDFGDSWKQAEVPVRVAILDIYFPTSEKGWAVGHSGVILHSDDGGQTWSKQFDGMRLGTEGLAYYQKMADADPDDDRANQLVGEMEYAVAQGADKPFFKVYFTDENTGYVMGAYGALFKTVDGGQNWIPDMEVLDVSQYPHLYDFALDDGNYVLVGEMGNVFLKDEDSGLYVAQDFPFDGSIFTVLSTGPGHLFCGGLRGLAFHSEDGGHSWSESDKPESVSINDSLLLADGRVLIASDDGKLMVSSDGGLTFSILPVEHSGRISSVIESRPGELLVSGPFGIHKLGIGQ